MQVTLKVWNSDKCAVDYSSITGPVLDMIDTDKEIDAATVEDAAICYITETLKLELDFVNTDFSVEL